MVTFRSVATDDNPYGTSATQVKVSRPAGVVDGDFLIASIAVADGSSSSITPPAGWVFVKRVDASTTVSLAVYYKFAIGEPAAGWAWGFTNAQPHTVVVRAYSGVDVFAPIDADNGASQIAASSQILPSLTVTTPGLMAVESTAISVAGATSITLSVVPATGYTARATSVQSTLALEVTDSVLATNGVITNGAETYTFGGVYSPIVAMHVMALRPSVGKSTLEQVRQAFKTAFPPGADDLYDWDNPDTDIYKLTVAAATILKYYGFDYADFLRSEFQPLTTVVKLADWESAYGVSTTAQSVTAVRQNAVIAKLRESGGSTRDNIRLAVEPNLGYLGSNIGTLQIVECDRTALTALHTYSNATGAAILAAGNTSQSVTVPDDGLVSIAGVKLTVTLTSTAVDNISFVLNGPGSGGLPASVTWPAGALGKGSVTSQQFTLYDIVSSPAKNITGAWTLQITAGSANVTLVSWSLFVEGIGLDSSGHDGLGSAIFDWGAYADPAKNINADFLAARNSINKISPAHTVGHLLLTISAIPDNSTTLPGACYPA